MAWHDVEDRNLPAGVVAVDGRASRVLFGAETVRRWDLERYKTVAVKMNDNPTLIGFQLFRDDRGSRELYDSGTQGTGKMVSCQAALRQVGAKKGRYMAIRDQHNFIIVDFGKQVPAGWTPQHG